MGGCGVAYLCATLKDGWVIESKEQDLLCVCVCTFV